MACRCVIQLLGIIGGKALALTDLRQRLGDGVVGESPFRLDGAVSPRAVAASTST